MNCGFAFHGSRDDYMAKMGPKIQTYGDYSLFYLQIEPKQNHVLKKMEGSIYGRTCLDGYFTKKNGNFPPSLCPNWGLFNHI